MLLLLFSAARMGGVHRKVAVRPAALHDVVASYGLWNQRTAAGDLVSFAFRVVSVCGPRPCPQHLDLCRAVCPLTIRGHCAAQPLGERAAADARRTVLRPGSRVALFGIPAADCLSSRTHQTGVCSGPNKAAGQRPQGLVLMKCVSQACTAAVVG